MTPAAAQAAPRSIGLHMHDDLGVAHRVLYREFHGIGERVRLPY
jgi:hypothetical protein